MKPLRCPACGGGPIVALADVTVHQRLYALAGRVVVGPIIDTLAAVRADANEAGADVGGAYCWACSAPVDARAVAANPPKGGGGPA